MTDTIVALSSGSLPAGIAVVRVSGPQSRFAVETIFGRVPKPRFASYGAFLDADNAVIDRGLALFFPGPRTESGEDGAEFHCHGGRTVVTALLGRLVELPGVRLAEPGEFIRRAFLNGKVDLAQVEGLSALLGAQTEAQRRLAVQAADGHQSRQYLAWRQMLLDVRASLEAELDFSDQDDVNESRVVSDTVDRVASEIDKHLGSARQSEIVREGFRIVILGPVNAGKSSLINVLAKRDIAITSPEAGTTRDLVEVNLDLGGYQVVITDTAGLREAGGEVEKIGIARALRAAETADLILWVSSNETALSADLPKGVPVWELHSKSDLRASARDGAIGISTLTGEGVPQLIERLGGMAAQVGHVEGIAPANLRHAELLSETLASLRAIDAGLPAEVRAEYLRAASTSLGRIVGLIHPEELLGAIFSQFCIGK